MNIVMIVSGKGGVGKSLVSANLAYGLSKAGKRVALYDMDYSNPNLAEILGIKDEIHISKEEVPEFYPIIHDDIEFFSMANICGNKPVSMEGAMYGQIVRDVLSRQKNWKAEIGICDMSAGLSDPFLEIVNVFGENLLGSIVVFVPAHVESARSLLQLHQNEGVPVLGIIENFSHFRCPKCEETYQLFGEDLLSSLAEEFKVKPLGSIPLSMTIRNGILSHNPVLPPPLDEPINNALKEVLEAKPVGYGFFEKTKEKLKGVARGVLVDIFVSIVEIVNEEIDLKALAQRRNFSERRIVELDMTDKTLRTVRKRFFMQIKNGFWGLMSLETAKKHLSEGESLDEIRVWDKAFLWVILGQRKDTGIKYACIDAWAGGHAKYSSVEAGTQRALKFMGSKEEEDSIWVEIFDAIKNTKGFQWLKPIIERVA